MFEKTLTDLVTGIRSHKRDTALFISQSIAEVKVELQSPDFFVKSNALQKLTFLQMMGYTMSWAAFAAVEVMSSPRFALKRVGCLAACQGLDQPDRSPVVLLTTNHLKKELRGATVGGSGESSYHAGLAINCLSNIVTEDLGRELLPDLLHLLKHPSPYVRKKALLCLYKVFLKYPQGLRLSFDRIKSCLEDSHPSVVSCAVNVITELSDKNPNNYLPLAPAFFKLLTSSANNWMLIKVVKLLGSLVPEEPRLAKKLLDPLSGIVKSTHAKSLLYEAAFAITLCLQYVDKGKGSRPSNIPEVVELCASTLQQFVSDNDQNLKYLGLVGFGSLLRSQPDVLHSHSECRSLILKCLSDEDVTIRARALGLLRFVTTQRNLVELVTQLLGHVEAAGGEYRSQLVEEIVRMCSSNKYELVADFAWYVDVLAILARVRGVEQQGSAIAGQWMDVAWRVLPVRAYAVAKSAEVLIRRGSGSHEGRSEGERHVMSEVLPAAAWVVGEYSYLIPEALQDVEGLGMGSGKSAGPHHALIHSMSSPTDAAGIDPLAMTTQAVFVQNAMKVFAAATRLNNEGGKRLSCSDDELSACAGTLMNHLAIYQESPDVEVKERAFTARQLLLSIGLPSEVNPTSTSSIASKCRTASPALTYLLVPEPMKPISAKLQRRKLGEGPPSPISIEEWEGEVDWDAFFFLSEETAWFDKDGNVRGSIESICFTEQRSNVSIKESKGEVSQPIGSDMASFGGDTTGAYDSTTGPTRLTPIPHQRDGDPFYLNSTTAPTGKPLDAPNGGDADGATKETTDAPNRFGSIQLDSGGESEGGRIGSRSKRRKKKKSKRLEGLAQQKIVESDDDEDGVNTPQHKRWSVSKEFQNLALVDLTAPLAEHEVMPVNEHYVVPERPTQRETKNTSKKAKKKSKTGKIKRKPQRLTATPVVDAPEEDLLGFEYMDFGPATGEEVAVAGASVLHGKIEPSSNINPVNSAFDDLLGLEMPQPSTGSANSPSIPVTKPTTEVGASKPKVKKQKKEKKKSRKKT